MSSLLKDDIANPAGETFTVSTIKTLAGGAPNESYAWTPFTMADYEDFSIWPFETMVFPGDGSRCGLYHEAHATEDEAAAGHQRICDQIRKGLEFPGETVTSDELGTPTLTAEEWRRKLASREQKECA